MFRFLLPMASLLLAHSLAAQNAALPIFCGDEVLHHIAREHYPELEQAFQTSFEENLRHSAAVQQRAPQTIRVVVHVVWKNPDENLADSIILNQIQVLNEDYNRENADTARLRAPFRPVAGNPQIRFELAGIVRVQTTANFQVDLQGTQILANLKSSAQGGSDAWNTSAYLNLWVCKIQPITLGGLTIGQILGFAFPPNNLGHWPANSGAPSPSQDGVVLDFRVVGRNNPNTVPIPGGSGNLVVRGRTATHEVGHYLGLRHIWGDGGFLGLPNDCNQSDGVADTPFASAQSPFDCDTTRNSCAKVETHYGQDMPDLIENYMDYSSEACMNMFTQGQVGILHSVLAGPRNGLVQLSSSDNPVAEALPELFPNPASQQAWLRLPEGWQTRSLELIGADGRMLALPVSSDNLIRIETGTLAPGWYALRVGGAERVWVTRLVVAR